MKHLIDTSSLTLKNINEIFEYATEYKNNIDIAKILIDKTVVIVFFEPSTRTTLSFDMSAKKLGANVVVLNIPTSSNIGKSEDIIDTIRTIDAMNPDFIIIRNGQNGLIESISKSVSCSIINGGEGTVSHPSQALIDFFTITELTTKSIEDTKIAICGDILHSRVARSNISIMKKIGIKPIFIAPEIFLNKDTDVFNEGKIYRSLDEALQNEDIDFLIMLRVQFERINFSRIEEEKYLKDYTDKERLRFGHAKSKNFYHDDFHNAKFGNYYLDNFRLDQNKLDKSLNKNIKILHPGPVNKDLEITEEVIQNNSDILTQVTNSIYVRQAIFKFLSINK